MTLDYYRIFYYVAKYKSFSKAAEILFSKNTYIKKFIINLKKQNTCNLFIKSN